MDAESVISAQFKIDWLSVDTVLIADQQSIPDGWNRANTNPRGKAFGRPIDIGFVEHGGYDALERVVVLEPADPGQDVQKVQDTLVHVPFRQAR